MKIEFPVFFHNSQSYDNHFIVQALGKLNMSNVVKSSNVISKSSEKFLAININNNIRILDSLAFTLSSLEKLVETMVKDGTDLFKTTREEYALEEARGANLDLLFRKGVFPYGQMKSVKDFKLKKIPPREAFFNDLRDEPPSLNRTINMLLKCGKVFRLKIWGNINCCTIGVM
jgi:hypothetical protein